MLLVERCGLLAGEAEFIRVLLMAFTGLRWGETLGLQASYTRVPDRRRNHCYVRVEWQMIELNRRHQRVRLPRGVRISGRAGRSRPEVKLRCGVVRPASDGVYPAQKRRRGCHTERWRVRCSGDPFPGIPVPTSGIHRAKAEQLAECSWAALVLGLTPHGLRHGHQTALRRDRVPRVLRRNRLGHGPSGDIADHYTHIDNEMTEDMLASQTQRWRAAVTARARVNLARDAVPGSAVPALDEWLALFRERPGEIPLPFALPSGGAGQDE